MGQVDAQQGGVGLQPDGLAVGVDGLARAAFLEQNLALQLPQIGVVDVPGDQGVGGVQGALGLAVAIPGDGAGVAGREGGVAFQIAAQGLGRGIHEGVDLGQDQGVLGQPPGAVPVAVVGRGLDGPAQGLDALAGQGVAAEIGIAAGVGENLLTAEILEELDQAPTGFAGGFQSARGGDVGLALLALHVAQGPERAEILAGPDQRHAGARLTGRDGQGAERHRHQHGLHARALGAVAQGVPILDVTGLVGEHAQQLVGVAGAQDQAGVDADDPPARGEGVQLGIIDQQDLDLGRFETHGREHRVRPPADDALDLGIADRALRGGGSGRRHHEDGGGRGDQPEKGGRDAGRPDHGELLRLAPPPHGLI